MVVFRYIHKIYDYLKWNLLLGSFGLRSIVSAPYRLKGDVRIGKNVRIKTGGWIETSSLTGNKAEIEIGDNCDIGRFVEIFATKRIRIGHDVLLGERIYISDNSHRYNDPDVAVHAQGVEQLGEVTIGEGSWIGSGACIIGVSIGKHCVIGANSVVNRDIPDYCVAAGVPARVIRRYDREKGEWIKCERHES